jgi:4-hydroxybenzoate polyprenyltransferase
LNQLTLREQILGLVQLTRWREYVTFVIPLTVMGALLAARPNDILLDWRLVAVTLANILAVAYAFMINDIEDAPDDARDPARAARNPISTGKIGVRLGYAACRLVAVVTLVLYALGGGWAFAIGIATLLLSHLYSWRPVRLKAWPVTDIVSHSLMLSGLLFLAGYFVYHDSPGIMWLVAAGATLVSIYGQLYNQLRDYDMDKAAGLHNTAIILGVTNTRVAMYLSIGLAVACLAAAAIQGAFPLWLGIVMLLSIPVSWLFRSGTDMRGTVTKEVGGMMQAQMLVIVNLTIGAWLVEAIVRQVLQV